MAGLPMVSSPSSTRAERMAARSTLGRGPAGNRSGATLAPGLRARCFSSHERRMEARKRSTDCTKRARSPGVIAGRASQRWSGLGPRTPQGPLKASAASRAASMSSLDQQPHLPEQPAMWMAGSPRCSPRPQCTGSGRRRAHHTLPWRGRGRGDVPGGTVAGGAGDRGRGGHCGGAARAVSGEEHPFGVRGRA